MKKIILSLVSLFFCGVMFAGVTGSIVHVGCFSQKGGQLGGQLDLGLGAEPLALIRNESVAMTMTSSSGVYKAQFVYSPAQGNEFYIHNLGPSASTTVRTVGSITSITLPGIPTRGIVTCKNGGKPIISVSN